MPFFAAATAWIHHLSGPTPTLETLELDRQDVEALRDFRAMKDAETRGGARSRPLPRRHGRGRGRNLGHMQRRRPQPKSVAHKEPTRGKKSKDRVESNRLGKLYMA